VSVFTESCWDKWAKAVSRKRGVDAELASLISSVSDWDAWLSHARSERLSGALWTAFRDNNIQALLPSGVAQKMEFDWRQSVVASVPLLQNVGDIATLLDCNDIPWMLLKGPSVADVLYSDPGASPIVDIDILLKPFDFTRALDQMQRSGWQLRNDMHPRYLELTRAVLTREGSYVSILKAQWNLLGAIPLANEDKLWDNPEEIEVGGRAVKTLSAADKALYLAVHAVLYHGLRPSAQLLDICLACGRLDRKGWSVLINHAKQTGLVEEVFLALTTARTRINMVVPESVMSDLLKSRPKGLRRKAPELVMSDTGGRAATTLSRLIMMHGTDRKKKYLSFIMFPPKNWLAHTEDSIGPGAHFNNAFSGLGKAIRQLLAR